MRFLGRKVLASVAVAGVLLVALAAPASATWSIVGIDPETGEVGLAIASCVPPSTLGDLTKPLKVVALSPGQGVGVSQGLLNQDVPPEMVRLLSSGQSAASVIESVTSAQFDADSAIRQHAVVTSDGVAAAFTGTQNRDIALDRQADNVSAQGNIVVSQAVIDDAMASFQKGSQTSLAERLVNALEAGSNAGGDSRCGTQTALFAHVVVAQPDDDPLAPTVQLTATVNEGSGQNPVDLLAAQYRSGVNQGETLNATRPKNLTALGVVALAALALAIAWLLRRIRSHI